MRKIVLVGAIALGMLAPSARAETALDHCRSISTKITDSHPAACDLGAALALQIPPTLIPLACILHSPARAPAVDVFLCVLGAGQEPEPEAPIGDPS